MKLSTPKHATFYIAMLLAIVGLIAYFVTIPVLSGFAIWLIIAGFVILALGNLLEGF